MRSVLFLGGKMTQSRDVIEQSSYEEIQDRISLIEKRLSQLYETRNRINKAQNTITLVKLSSEMIDTRKLLDSEMQQLSEALSKIENKDAQIQSMIKERIYPSIRSLKEYASFHVIAVNAVKTNAEIEEAKKRIADEMKAMQYSKNITELLAIKDPKELFERIEKNESLKKEVLAARQNYISTMLNYNKSKHDHDLAQLHISNDPMYYDYFISKHNYEIENNRMMTMLKVYDDQANNMKVELSSINIVFKNKSDPVCNELLKSYSEGVILKNKLNQFSLLLSKNNLPDSMAHIKDEYIILVDEFKKYHENLMKQYKTIDLLESGELKSAIANFHRELTENVSETVLDNMTSKLTEKIEVEKLKWMNIYLIDDMSDKNASILQNKKYHHSYVLAKNTNELYYINKQGQREKVEIKDADHIQSITSKVVIENKLTSPVPVNEYISDVDMVELDSLIKKAKSPTLLRENELRDHFYNFRVDEIGKALDEKYENSSGQAIEFGPVNLNASTRIMYVLLKAILNDKDTANPQVVFYKSEDDKSILAKYLDQEYNLTTLLRHVDWRHMPRFDDETHQAYMDFLKSDFGHGGSQVKPERPDSPLAGTWKIKLAGRNYRLSLPLEDPKAKKLENIVYVSKQKGVFRYSCIGPDGASVEGEMSKKDLMQHEQDPAKIQAIKKLENPLDQDKLAFLHPYILAEMNKRGHALYSPTNERVDNVIANIHDNDRKEHDYLNQSDAEVSAINIYTGNSSYLMNKLLRNDTMTYEDEFLAKLHVNYDDFVDRNQSRKYFTRGISELLMHVAMVSSAAHKPKEHNWLEYDTLTISVLSKEELSEEKLTALQKEHGNIPILINENGNISIYGFDGKEWTQSALLNADVFKAVQFPPVGKVGEILSGRVTDEMKAEMRKAHVNDPQVIVRRLEISAGKEWLFDAIKEGIKEKTPQYVPGQTLQSTAIEARSTYTNISGDNMVGLFYRNDAPGVKAKNASQFQGEGELILGPGITLLYDAIVQEAKSHIVSTRVISTPQGRAEDPYEEALKQNPIEFHAAARAVTMDELLKRSSQAQFENNLMAWKAFITADPKNYPDDPQYAARQAVVRKMFALFEYLGLGVEDVSHGGRVRISCDDMNALFNTMTGDREANDAVIKSRIAASHKTIYKSGEFHELSLGSPVAGIVHIDPAKFFAGLSDAPHYVSAATNKEHWGMNVGVSANARAEAADGSHGHLYLNTHFPKSGKTLGALLIGVEGAEPGKKTQFGEAHGSAATKNALSATGATKKMQDQDESYIHIDDAAAALKYINDNYQHIENHWTAPTLKEEEARLADIRQQRENDGEVTYPKNMLKSNPPLSKAKNDTQFQDSSEERSGSRRRRP